MKSRDFSVGVYMQRVNNKIQNTKCKIKRPFQYKEIHMEQFVKNIIMQTMTPLQIIDKVIEEDMGLKMWHNLSLEQRREVKADDRDSRSTDYNVVDIFHIGAYWCLFVKPFDMYGMYGGQIPPLWKFNLTTMKPIKGFKPPSDRLFDLLSSIRNNYK